MIDSIDQAARAQPFRHFTLRDTIEAMGGVSMRIAVSLFVIAWVLAPSVYSQDQKQNEERSKFEPRSEPGAGQVLLKRFEGDWNVTKILHRQSGEPVRSEGRCRQTMIHDGRFLQSEITFERDGKKTTGLGIIGFEPESGTFTSFWTDSRQTRMSVRQSKDRFDGGESSFIAGRSPRMAGNRASRRQSHGSRTAIVS